MTFKPTSAGKSLTIIVIKENNKNIKPKTITPIENEVAALFIQMSFLPTFSSIRPASLKDMKG